MKDVAASAMISVRVQPGIKKAIEMMQGKNKSLRIVVEEMLEEYLKMEIESAKKIIEKRAQSFDRLEFIRKVKDIAENKPGDLETDVLEIQARSNAIAESDREAAEAQKRIEKYTDILNMAFPEVN